MMTLYEKFRQIKTDFSAIGLGPGCPDVRYFCIPRGAESIGQAGTGGVQYCFIDGFGEMVFAVNPNNLPGEYVHPLARSFEDFLRLLLVCGDVKVMEQAYRLNRESFDTEVWENNFLDEEQKEAHDSIKREFSLTPMPDSYTYIKELQASFDYSKIQFTEDYTVWGPEEPAAVQKLFASKGKEIRVNRQFIWGGSVWRILSLYTGEEELTIDICMKVEPERIRVYMEKWNLISMEEDIRQRRDEEREQMLRENPLNFGFRVQVKLESETLRQTRGDGYSWIPLSCLSERRYRDDYAMRDAKPVMQHYRLDPAASWAVYRNSLSWTDGRRPEIKTLRLRLEQDPVQLPGPCFTVSGAGEKVSFTHPSAGTEHTLTVLECEQQEVNTGLFPDQEWEYPSCCLALTYVISPDVPGGRISIQDCARGDSPRRRNPPDPNAPESVRSCVLLAVPRGGSRVAVSSLYFEPAENVRWRMTFYEKTLDDIEEEISIDEQQ